jgi:endonuclease VIII
MPEGDTIFRAARTLHRALAGHAVVRFDSVFPALMRVHTDTPITGRTIEAVWSAGKHLLMQFAGELVLRTHMRMHGSWHIYRPGEAWQRARRDMRVLLATKAIVAVGFNVPVAEFIAANRLAHHPELARLGPDLLADDFDEAEAIGRMRAVPTRPIADVLLNQQVVAGVGNVYKSEVLFVCGVNPWVRTADLDDETLARLLATSRRMLRLNVRDGVRAMTTYGGLRRTTGRHNPRDRLWVYGRAGQRCRRCGAEILMKKADPDARLTYWCPHCQGGVGRAVIVS